MLLHKGKAHSSLVGPPGVEHYSRAIERNIKNLESSPDTAGSQFQQKQGGSFREVLGMLRLKYQPNRGSARTTHVSASIKETQKASLRHD